LRATRAARSATRPTATRPWASSTPSASPSPATSRRPARVAFPFRGCSLTRLRTASRSPCARSDQICTTEGPVHQPDPPFVCSVAVVPELERSYEPALGSGSGADLEILRKHALAVLTDPSLPHMVDV